MLLEFCETCCEYHEAGNCPGDMFNIAARTTEDASQTVRQGEQLDDDGLAQSESKQLPSSDNAVTGDVSHQDEC